MSPKHASLVVLGFALAALPACGDDGGGGDPDAAIDAPDLDAPPDAPIDAPPDAPLTACTSVDACPWIDTELRSIVSVLSGAEPTPQGVTLTRRASAMQRQQTRDYLTGKLQALGLTVEPRNYGTGTNLVVRLEPTVTPSTTPLLIVGGHFDGVPASPAAADNATGTAIAVVAAKYLEGRPRSRPIEIVLFDQEEAGLVGSGAYVAAMGPNAVIHAAYNFDMISYDSDGDRMVELWSPAPRLEALFRQHAATRGMGIVAVSFALSDHQSFVERGLPAVGACEEFVSGDHTPHYHRSTDTLDKIDFTYLGMAARLGLAVVEDDALD